MYLVSEIEWDIEPEERESCNLPSELFIPDSEICCLEDEEVSDAISDYLTNLTDFCVCGFVIDKLDDNTKVIFTTKGADSDWKCRDYEECRILRPLNASKVDIFDVGAVYKIQFSDGTEMDAFADELYINEGGAV